MGLLSYFKAMRLAARNISRLDMAVAELQANAKKQADRYAKTADELNRELETHRQELAVYRQQVDLADRDVQALRADCDRRAGELNRQQAEWHQQLVATDRRLAAIESLTAGERGSLPGWWECQSYVDPSLRAVLSLLCPVNGTVFDVGANIGTISILLSRLVGPGGRVCAFEASPRILHELSRNLLHNLCHNVAVLHAAVYRESHRQMDLFLNASHAADSIVFQSDPTGGTTPVSTLALDDFIGQTGLVPDLVKMDIEGAEPDALAGMRRTLGEHRPHLLLETFPSATGTIAMLRELGYRSFDCGTLEELTAQSVLWKEGTHDIVHIHADRIAATPLAEPIRWTPCGGIAPTQFETSADGRQVATPPVDLPAGLYQVRFDVSSEPGETVVLYLTVGAEKIGHLHASWDILALNWPHFTFYLNQPGALRIHLDAPGAEPVKLTAIPRMQVLSTATPLPHWQPRLASMG